MKLTGILLRISFKSKGFAVLIGAMFFICSCTKPSENYTPAVQLPVVVNPPTGDIQSFTLTDTLVAFNNGSTAKWLVTNINPNTVITFNGVKVASYGVLDTGPLKQTSTFTLAINNGKQAALTLKVADSITSLLWGKGRRLKQIKLQYYLVPAGQTSPVWIDTAMKAAVADQRIYFSLDGTSKIYQSTASTFVAPGDGGRFVVNAAQTAFTWQGITYIIGSIDNNGLDVTYDIVVNGKTMHARNIYLFE